MIKTLKVFELKPHPENNFYFDDMSGDKWLDFLASVESRGVIEPILVTDENVIVSGHQRVRACNELGITEIMCDVRHYETQTDVLRDLLETNLMQRGEIISGYTKKARILEAMRQFYGVKRGGNGSNQYTDNKNVTLLKYQNDTLANPYETVKEKLGLSKNDADRILRFAKLIPEIQEAVDDEKLPFTVASNLIYKLSESEQQQLLDMLPDRKVTGKEIQQYVEQIRAKDTEIADLKAQKEAAEQEAQNMREEAVEAVRQVNGSKDAEKYQQMKEARDKAVQERRDIYEENQRLRKEKDKLIENTHKANEEINKRVRQLERELESARSMAENASEPVVETVEVEVVPSDYEELKHKAQMYDESFSKMVASKEGYSLKSEYEQNLDFLNYVTNTLQPFLPNAQSLLIQKDKLHTIMNKNIFLDTSIQIVDVMQQIINELKVEVA